MASAFSHAVAAFAIGSVFYPPKTSKRILTAGVICSVIPDLDVIGFGFGIRYGDFFGHRGFTHSLFFAAATALTVTVSFFPRGTRPDGRLPVIAYLFLATASHGVLDAMTNGGLGVAFFSPFNVGRYFFPWRPILVSPISLVRFFSGRGCAVLQSEILWIWLPAAIVFALAWVLRATIREETRPSAGGQSLG
jgi:inner membrane protein